MLVERSRVDGFNVGRRRLALLHRSSNSTHSKVPNRGQMASLKSISADLPTAGARPSSWWLCARIWMEPSVLEGGTGGPQCRTLEHRSREPERSLMYLRPPAWQAFQYVISGESLRKTRFRSCRLAENSSSLPRISKPGRKAKVRNGLDLIKKIDGQAANLVIDSTLPTGGSRPLNGDCVVSEMPLEH